MSFKLRWETFEPVLDECHESLYIDILYTSVIPFLLHVCDDSFFFFRYF